MLSQLVGVPMLSADWHDCSELYKHLLETADLVWQLAAVSSDV